MTITARIALGAFSVAADRAEAEAFRAATKGTSREGDLPLTFPMRWLMRPDVRAALMTLLPEPDLIPVHESQSFDYARPLAVATNYTLDVSGQRSEGPDRLTVTADVHGVDGTPHAQLETVLRLVSTKAAA